MNTCNIHLRRFVTFVLLFHHCCMHCRKHERNTYSVKATADAFEFHSSTSRQIFKS